MHIYDFDGTIYDGDSTIDFYLFMAKRHPSILCRLPAFLLKMLQHKFGKCSTRALKESFFSFLPKVQNISREVDLFWETHMDRIMPWYLKQKQETDVVISASPAFLLKTPCEKLGIGTLIASEVHECDGRFLSENCKGEEKVVRFRAQFPGAVVSEFYSDSLSDLPMARIAEKAFLIKNKTVRAWNISERTETEQHHE